MTTFFTELKRGTAASHTALEATYPFNTMMKPDIFDRQAYTQNLLILASFHNCVSKNIQKTKNKASLSEFIEAESVMRAVNQDLNALGRQPEYPDFPLIAQPDSPESALAGAYVWMGSSMGARILYRWLNHAGYEELPTAYYQQMITLGQHWPAFVEHGLDYVQRHNVDVDKCTEIANQLFDGLQVCANTLTHQQQHPA
ncbi:biliverdin-producing heme oxygenase [Salinimonas sp. HHU 13199]|uniref:Biliverdin-producing heme oxygenase n=1 Tax=Salinimonas profundi TaxID=2729140 RepID=A0ABR8LHT7_9ALTE|nr:biliverdin-producing heme oxygenase [Salinimonas profundi]MBD3584850.1 biliverdin-producing heme oxygenase [Salinimonas profundi]